MTNSKTRKTGKTSKKAAITHNNSLVVNDAGGMDEVDGSSTVWMQNGNNDGISPDVSDIDTEDADDEIIDDGDTSTSFSLQECMNEFRARRIRRISSSQNRQEAEKSNGNSCHDATEIDLINQNLCNKEQERKCKPCKDGFCYCFTSDSGDGGGGSVGVCGAARGVHVRHSRRQKRPDCTQTWVSGKQHSKSPKKLDNRRQSLPPNMKIPQNAETSKFETTKIGHNQITAISRLETSEKDAPLIHIIQELRENCVISEVRVNKHKIQTAKRDSHIPHVTHTNATNKLNFNDDVMSKKKSAKFRGNAILKATLEPHTPTAPPLERISELDTPNTSENVASSSLDDKIKYSVEPRHKAGGLLLQKRLSNAHFNYKPRDVREPPPKPPRSSLSSDDKSTTSTTSSVRAAERVVDDFLVKRGIIMKSTTAKEKILHTLSAEQIKRNKKNESDKRKSYPLSPKELKKSSKKIQPTYPSLSDLERVVESKKSTHYEKNIRRMTENQPKVISIGWNEANINDMLNYDANVKSKEFRSTSTQAQPQHRSGHDIEHLKESIGWQVPPKVDLDTVDGFVRHNLESNIENKNTPVKTKLFVPMKSKGASQTQKFIWSEQLRHLSPWSNKHISNNSPNVIRKSNLRSSSKAFLKSSKKKILRLVSPKKENKERINFQIRKTPYRNVGIQTSCDDLSHHGHRSQDYEPSCTQQSPPGSYHSPVQSSHLQSPSSTQSQNTTPNGIDSTPTHFDFSRTVHSPPKKAPRSSQRKLNFPLNSSVTSKVDHDGNVISPHAKDKKTYRSYNMELDQDVSISKISYILSNIRAKLEASDEHALRTFRETERRGPGPSGLDCLDGHRGLRQETEVEIHESLEQDVHRQDPIYSEIEEDSFHIAESAFLDNHTAIQHFNVHNPEILYATVNKSKKRMVDTVASLQVQHKTQQQPTALAKILQDSLKCKKITTNITPLPTLSEPPESETASYSSPLSLIGQLPHCQSLNNVRVMEHNSPPKRQRNLSKSDLSLHRSEIFLENLCRSELIIDGCGVAAAEQEHLEKIQNNKTNQSYISMTQPTPNDLLNTSSESNHELPHNDTVSYELPNDVDMTADSIDADDSTTAGSNLALNRIAPPSSDNQSTPKKQSFTTKGNPNRSELNNRDVLISNANHSSRVSLSVSCPTTPHKLNGALRYSQLQTSHSQSLNAVTDHENVKSANTVSTGTLTKYKCLKNVLRKSFRKSKQFINSERKRLSTSLRLPASNSVGNQTSARSTQSSIGSNLELEALFALNESTSVREQLAQTVSICRKLPDLEISSEMVEAERLLLFSALRREKCPSPKTASRNLTMNQQPKMRFFIDEMFVPIRADVNQDIFFNYFYIVTFECGGIIKSTQSAECQNGSAVFRDCGIEFILCSELVTNDDTHDQQHAVRCNVFMLRLRKVSTLGFEPKNRKTPEPFTTCPSASQSSTSSSSSVHSIVSRFRLHASFTLDSSDFVPYEYVPQETNNSDRVCVRASRNCHIPLIPRTKSTNLSRELQLKGRAEVRFPKRTFAGFLNVEDPHSQHNWNRRWCTLDGIYLHVWHDVNCLNESPLLSVDLRDNKTNVTLPLTSAPRELCARQRSFCLESKILKADEHISTATIFFATDSQDDLDDWLKILNEVLDFIVKWLS